MTGGQQLVGAGGVALVLVNYWTGPDRADLTSGIIGGGDAAKARRALTKFAGELAFVAVATLLAGVSDGWSTAMGAVIVALFILWAINHYGPAKPAATTTSQPMQGVVAGGVSP